MVVVVWGRHIKGVKPIVRLSDELVLCEFYNVNHLYFIPLEKERKFGLFQDGNKKTYFEIDERLEKRLLSLSQEAQPNDYGKEIKKFNLDMDKIEREYEINKDKIEAKDNQEFVKFLKTVGIIFAIIILAFIISILFF